MKLRLAISACLLGEQVRWNGGHKKEDFLTDIVGPHVAFHPFCPEDAVLGTPRPTLRLERIGDEPRAITKEGIDHTDALVEHLPATDVHGVILKSASPSCGLNVPVWKDGKQNGRAPGVVAACIQDIDVPVTEEGRLREPNWREHFFDQAFCWLRWEALGTPDAAALQAWHARHKLTFMAHHPEGTKRLGQLAASGDVPAYRALLPEVLKTQSSRGRHANVLSHIQGYVSDAIDASDRDELVATIRQYQEGIVPLLVPLTLLQHHARKHAPAWLREQTYLDPYPAEWMLRA